MTIKKCDICRKKIDHDSTVAVRLPYTMASDRSSLIGYELCLDCSNPVQAFLKKRGLLKTK
jgi:hypothetical protein